MSDSAKKIRGPFQLLESRSTHTKQASPFLRVVNNDQILGELLEPPTRNYQCPNYECCLDIASELDWDSFSCGSCCGEICPKLLAESGVSVNSY